MGNLERIVFIDKTIRKSGGIRLAEIVKRFEVSERQAKRDLEFLRYRLDAPLQWDYSQRWYGYLTQFPGLDFADEKALLFYVFARAAAGTLAYVPLAEAEALDRLRDLVPPALRGLEGAVRYDLPDFEPADTETLALLLRAIGAGKALEADYRDLEGKEGNRLLAPRRIINYAGTWYCLAFDHALRQLRTYKVSRFGNISRLLHSAEGLPGDEAVETYLEASYGMFKGMGDKLAVLRFRGRAGEIVRGEIWHPDQKARQGRDPSGGPWFELEVPVSRWEEILGRLLRFGAEGEAVAPPEFRNEWLAAIEAMAEVGRAARAADAGTERL
jgi:predicted DNA-binding transcriptional regulator YafY